MNIPQTDTTIVEHRCEALTISEIPPYRCTTSATDDRQGREVCPSHARAPHVSWFDDDNADVLIFTADPAGWSCTHDGFLSRRAAPTRVVGNIRTSG
jgi:hypothetical protein